MSRGTIAVIVLDDDVKTGLEAAIVTARNLSLHLEVFCLARASLRLLPPTMADAFDPAPRMEDRSTGVTACESLVRERLAIEGIEWSVPTIPADAEAEALGSALMRHLRFADLVLVPRSGAVPGDAVRLFATILYSTRAPVLLSDAGVDATCRVMLAWDESDVALAAIRAAEPFLSVAREVEIVTVDRPGAGEELAGMLSRRGIAPLLTPLPRSQLSVAQSLVRHAKATGTKLIVAGCCGGSPLGDKGLGGVTRDLLRHTSLPLLLAR